MIKNLFLLFLFTGATLLAAAPADKKNLITSIHEYTVQGGDSLYVIAHRNHTTIRELRRLNDLSENALLKPGQVLKIPGKTPSTKKKNRGNRPKSAVKKKSGRNVQSTKSAKKPSIYKVQAGDTISVIAQKFGTGSEELRRLNGLKKNSLIRVGQKLNIPISTTKETRKKGRPTVTTKQRGTRTATTKPGKTKVHTVQSGDTLFSIARKYHTPLKDLMSLNKIPPTGIIKPGQELKIPSKSYKVSTTTGKRDKKEVQSKHATKPVYHIVKHGEFLWKISKKYGVTIPEIRKLNNLRKGRPLRTGQKLLIKPGSPPKTQVAKAQKTEKKKAKKEKIAKTYTVRHGDSLWKIAKKHKLSLQQLREMNHLDKKSVIRSGMKLTVGYKEAPKAKVAQKKKKTKVKTKRASKTKHVKKKKVASRSKKKSRKKSADRRINSAMAALNGRSGGGKFSSGSNQVIRTAKRYLGRRYVWGAEGPSSFDCSGFTQYVMRKSKGVKLPRVSRKQAYYGKYVTFRNLRPGDLIFFDTSRRRRGYVNHVGIYIGNGKFIHASSARHRVVITSFRSHPFYRARFKWGRRVN